MTMSLGRKESTKPVAVFSPIALPGATSQRRLVVFSPKLERRVVLGNYSARRLWVAIEANPQISLFCERPAYVVDRGGRLIDFWVQYRSGVQEFWMLARPHENDIPPKLHGLGVRLIEETTAAVWDVPVQNWERILAMRTGWRRYRDALLEQRITVLLGVPMTLGEVVEALPAHDAQHVEASVYALLAEGRVNSPALAEGPLDDATVFRRA